MESGLEPFTGCTGRGIKVAIIDSGVNPAHPHVDGVAGGVRISPGEFQLSEDYLDYLGHGTAVAGAIREKAPDALLYAVKVFDRTLTTNIETIIRAIEWAIERNMNVINLSLGTTNMAHREKLERILARAVDSGAVLVAAHEMSGRPSLPGCLAPAIGVTADWECPRNCYRVIRAADEPVFVASAYPRDIPGVPRERNLNGISFAVANMTGFVARAREMCSAASPQSFKQLLVRHSTLSS